ncbi:MAG TPA: sigma-70 family RNA polymerase sigma factor [Burkholderiaceae bacterium]|jgi:RNA polymerase sigma-70 factor (ECF subfamily)|nr:sigma-70 family RNA polymerase sigma factor [Burkholderiaceae bacterium]
MSAIALAPSAVATATALAATATATAAMAIDFASHRGAMLRFARRKIRDEELAEDAVQDALLAALSSRESFQGKSALRTWLIGILNHKIQDVFRRESRYVRQTVNDSDDGDGSADDSLLETLPAMTAGDTHDPLREVARRHMHAKLAREVDALPPTLKEVFVLQVVEGVPTEEVCRRLNITEANCWVRLHRARKRLAERMRDHLD